MLASLDHIVLTCHSLEKTIAFYTQLLGMTVEEFLPGRYALKFGQQKINLHESGHEFLPHAHLPVPGALDLCFLSALPLDEVIQHLNQHHCEIIEGPVKRTGATQAIRSIYIRDPDLNLIEIAEKW